MINVRRGGREKITKRCHIVDIILVITVRRGREKITKRCHLGDIILVRTVRRGREKITKRCHLGDIILVITVHGNYVEHIINRSSTLAVLVWSRRPLKTKKCHITVSTCLTLWLRKKRYFVL